MSNDNQRQDAPVAIPQDIHCQEFYELVMDYRGAGFLSSINGPQQAYEKLCSYVNKRLAGAPVAAQPVGVAPVACSESGVLRWMTGRKIANCELYAAPQPAAQPSDDVARDALKVARAALHTAEYAIKGREHTGFITNAVAVIDAAMAQEKA